MLAAEGVSFVNAGNVSGTRAECKEMALIVSYGGATFWPGTIANATSGGAVIA